MKNMSCLGGRTLDPGGSSTRERYAVDAIEDHVVENSD